MSNMYERILFLCEQRGIKPGRLCSDTGLSRGMITDLKMERTKELSVKNTKIIADYFGVTADYLLTGEQKEKPAADDGNGLTPEQEEIIKLYDSAPPALKQAALAVLRAASSQDKAQDGE